VANTFTFEYTVNNGTTAKNGRAKAKVTVRVVGPDVFGLDGDGDGYGCE
jgi:hypothetical protein